MDACARTWGRVTDGTNLETLALVVGTTPVGPWPVASSCVARGSAGEARVVGGRATTRRVPSPSVQDVGGGGDAGAIGCDASASPRNQDEVNDGRAAGRDSGGCVRGRFGLPSVLVGRAGPGARALASAAVGSWLCMRRWQYTSEPSSKHRQWGHLLRLRGAATLRLQERDM